LSAEIFAAVPEVASFTLSSFPFHTSQSVLFQAVNRGCKRDSCAFTFSHSLLRKVTEILKQHKGKLYAFFTDLIKAFNMLNRSNGIKKLKGINRPSHAVTNVTRKILVYNYVTINGNHSSLREITQPSEILQGDPM
jgi:hypothetical protein